MDRLDLDAGRGDPFGDGVGHGLGAFPHGVVNNHRFLLRFLAAPLQVGLDDLPGVPAPDDPVVGADHIDGDARRHNFVDQFENSRCIEQ